MVDEYLLFKMIHSTVYENFIVVCVITILYIVYFYMFVTHSTSYSHCGKLLDSENNVCVCVCACVYVYVRALSLIGAGS
jgi:hypothetical protein